MVTDLNSACICVDTLLDVSNVQEDERLLRFACWKRIKTCRQKRGNCGSVLEVEHYLIGYVALYEVLVAAPASPRILGGFLPFSGKR